MTEPLLSVSLITYNHAPYIRQSIEGILMQQVNFPFEILIHDDASTDGTQDIIKEYANKYPDIIFPIFQTENQYSKGVKNDIEYNYRRARGKYIATCEGDDYWCDPTKLQQQVDILENHPEYSLCCHRADVLDEENNKISKTKDLKSEDGGFEFDYPKMKCIGWFFNTLSVVFRKDCLNFDIWKQYNYFRDVHQFYYLLKAGKGYYIEKCMAIYRLHSGGIYSSISRRDQIEMDLKVFSELYAKEKDPLLRHSIIIQLRGLAIFCIEHLKMSDFFRIAGSLEPKITTSMYFEAAYKVLKYYINKIIFRKTT